MIELGDKVKDVVTGIEGVLMATHEYLYSSKNFTVQPEGLFEGKASDGHSFDEPQGTLVKKNVIPTVPCKFHVKLGDEIKDTLTNFSGVCIGVAIWVNGCGKVLIQPKKLVKETGIPVEATWFDLKRVKLVKAADVKTKNRNGGPQPISSRQQFKIK